MTPEKLKEMGWTFCGMQAPQTKPAPDNMVLIHADDFGCLGWWRPPASPPKQGNEKEALLAELQAWETIVKGYDAENTCRAGGGCSPAFGEEHYQEAADFMREIAGKLRALDAADADAIPPKPEPEPLRCLVPDCSGEVVMCEDRPFGGGMDLWYSHCKRCRVRGPCEQTPEMAMAAHRKLAALTRGDG